VRDESASSFTALHQGLVIGTVSHRSTTSGDASVRGNLRVSSQEGLQEARRRTPLGPGRPTPPFPSSPTGGAISGRLGSCTPLGITLRDIRSGPKWGGLHRRFVSFSPSFQGLKSSWWVITCEPERPDPAVGTRKGSTGYGECHCGEGTGLK
jgi:hypothetical protein